MNNEIYESGEDYLETILRLKQQMGQVRSIDIARDLDMGESKVKVTLFRTREKLRKHLEKEGFTI